MYLDSSTGARDRMKRLPSTEQVQLTRRVSTQSECQMIVEFTRTAQTQSSTQHMTQRRNVRCTELPSGHALYTVPADGG